MKKIKKFILNKLGISKIKDKTNSLLKEHKKLKARIADLTKKNNELNSRIIENERRIQSLEGNLLLLTRKKISERRNPRIIISLTTFPGRIHQVDTVINYMFMQTMAPDKIVLWLSREQFPNLFDDLPHDLIQLQKYGLEIEWCEGDIKSYKKIIPALEKYPDDIIVTIDDDMMYDIDFIEKIYEAYLKYPDHIIASRVHQITLDENQNVNPYSAWVKECDFDTYKSRNDWFFTSGAGTLFPPKALGCDVTDISSAFELCPHADDIWLNIMAAINNTNILNIATCKHLPSVVNTQNERLWDINRTQNDVQLKAVVAHYSDKLNGSIYRFVISKDIAEY